MSNIIKEDKASLSDNASKEIYDDIRSRYSNDDAKTNGYRFHQYFLKEQQFLFSEIGSDTSTILDLASGSGLLTMPLKNDNTVVALDFNMEACVQASNNGLKAIRGDAYSLPLGDASIDKIICCQFFNQQPETRLELYFSEIYRVLRTGGEVFLLWRNGDALIHVAAHFFYKIQDKIVGRDEFPVYTHTIDDFSSRAIETGFSVKLAKTIMPLLNWEFINYHGFFSRMIGASNYLRLVKLENKLI